MCILLLWCNNQCVVIWTDSLFLPIFGLSVLFSGLSAQRIRAVGVTLFLPGPLLPGDLLSLVARRPDVCLWLRFYAKALFVNGITQSTSLSLSLSTWRRHKWLQRKIGHHARTNWGSHATTLFKLSWTKQTYVETCTSLLGDAWPMKIMCSKISSNY